METTESDTDIAFDPESGTYRLRYDRRSDESVSAAVIRGVGAVTDTRPTELKPLFETLDPDALDRLYDSTGGGSGRDDRWVSFRFGDCDVTVGATGEIAITPAAEDRTPITAPVPRTLRDR